MKVLGIETSCDETAIAIIGDDKKVYAHTLLSQIDDHKSYGGVVPELASRSHLSHISNVYHRTLLEAGLSLDDVDAIAVTAGPGLIGGLLVGVMFAKGLALAGNKPFLAINHLEGHALTIRLSHEVTFPYLMLLVSGGHCQILEVLGVGNYQMIGKTRDDSVGEAFDKVAKMLGLPYPGGPVIEALAENGNPDSIKFPRALLKDTPCDFSFSGLKTAVKRQIESCQLNEQKIADICASFQKTVSVILGDRLINAAKKFHQSHPHSNTIVIAGGVAANQYIKSYIQNLLPGYNIITPPIKLCTDNGIMIAWAGIERLQNGLVDTLDFEPRSRWPLDQLSNQQIKV